MVTRAGAGIEVGDRARVGLNPRITIPVTNIHCKWRSLRSASTAAMFAIVEMLGFPASYRSCRAACREGQGVRVSVFYTSTQSAGTSF